MRYLTTTVAFALVATAAAAGEAATGKIVWDAGIVTTDGKYNSQINELHIGFSPVRRDVHGKIEFVGEPKIRRHILGDGRRNTATYRDLDLPNGDYILSHLAYRENYHAFCLVEKTLLVEVKAGETQYLGQFQFNEPSNSPTLNANAYAPIYGIAYELENAYQNDHWQYGQAHLAKLEEVSVDSEIGACTNSTINIAAW